MLRNEGPLTPLAGATDLYVALNFGTLESTRFLNLWALTRSAASRCGTTPSGSARSPPTPHSFARAWFGGACRCWRARLVRWVESQIQNRGTLGGNIANGSPAGDTLPVLAVAEAVVVLRSVEGSGGCRSGSSIPATGPASAGLTS